MKIDIKHLAKLSKLSINEEQEVKFESQMQSIIEMVERLPELSSEDKLLDVSNPMKCREDIANNEFKREDILSNAPQMQAGCVVVPRIIE